MNCFHCNEAIDATELVSAEINQVQQSFCCQGCASVACMIDGQGLADFYQFRTSINDKVKNTSSNSYEVYDNPALQTEFFGEYSHNTSRTVQLVIEDIQCAACVWLVKNALSQMEHIDKVDVDSISKVASFQMHANSLKLSEIMQKLDRIGYPPLPYSPETEVASKNNYRNDILKRLGVAGLGMMQTMMFATGLYIGDGSLSLQGTNAADIASHDKQLLQWVSLLIATIVLGYSAAPFYKSAWKSIRSGFIGMDVPITVALFVAFGASVYNLLNHLPHVYFDTVTMFTFLILLGRLLEAQTRNHLAKSLASNSNKVPIIARLYQKTDQNHETDQIDSRNTKEQWLPIAELKSDQLILVKSGETIPVDGQIVDGNSQFDQSFVTGESDPVDLQCGDTVLAGSINLSSPVVIQCQSNDHSRLIDQIISFKHSGQQQKPAIERLLDQVAKYFSIAVLSIAVVVYFVWNTIDPSQALNVTLAVLVISCPCALSLAAPTASACSQYFLKKSGIAVANENFLETIPKVTDVLFDKTGTLTEGKISITDTRLASNIQRTNSDIHTKEQALQVAAALESRSEHPIAKAFQIYASRAFEASEYQQHNSAGVSAVINGKESYFLGSYQFICDAIDDGNVDLPDDMQANTGLFLADSMGIIAQFCYEDKLRDGMKAFIDYLHEIGKTTHIISGDPSDKTEKLAKQLGIKNYQFGLQPQDKLDYVAALNKQGKFSLMFGDGINDVPVLSVAHCSIAMGTGSDISLVSADAVLLNSDTTALSQIFNTAKRYGQILRSNIAWALCYNAITIPLAMLGLIPPYLAAIGMSASSLIVLWNATRLLKSDTKNTADNFPKHQVENNNAIKQGIKAT